MKTVVKQNAHRGMTQKDPLSSGQSHRQWIAHSSIGKLFLVASQRGLVGIFWTKQKILLTKSLSGSDPAVSHLARAVEQLNEYFSGRRTRFALKLDLAGTKFQKQVWKCVQAIPFGQTQSYQDIARKMKRPKAYRAVGNANGKNPVCIVLPCHRVILASGSLGGYSGRSGVKRSLLDFEKNTQLGKNGLKIGQKTRQKIR